MSRVQLAPNVSDLEASIAFSSALFGVEAQASRLRDAGLAAFDEKDITCCSALQEMPWVHDPHGAPWETYTVKDDAPANPQPPTSACC